MRRRYWNEERTRKKGKKCLGKVFIPFKRPPGWWAHTTLQGAKKFERYGRQKNYRSVIGVDMFVSQKSEMILVRIEKVELGSSRKVCCRGSCIPVPVISRNWTCWASSTSLPFFLRWPFVFGNSFWSNQTPGHGPSDPCFLVGSTMNWPAVTVTVSSAATEWIVVISWMTGPVLGHFSCNKYCPTIRTIAPMYKHGFRNSRWRQCHGT